MRSRQASTILWLSLVAGLLGVPLAAAETELLSLGLLGRGGNAPSGAPDLSADGRFVAFASEASNLVAGDDNDVSDVFVFDRDRGTIEMISVGLLGGVGSGESVEPEISDDGRYVLFQSRARNLVALDPGDGEFLYLRDRQNGTTSLITLSAFAFGIAPSGAEILDHDMTPDGRFALFTTTATDLGLTDTNEGPDVFVADLTVGAIYPVSVTPSRDSTGNAPATQASFSDDGQTVAFVSAATDLVPEGAHPDGSVFVRNLITGQTELVSRSPATGELAEERGDSPIVSPDGSKIAFSSRGTDLHPLASGNSFQMLLFDVDTAAIALVSEARDGGSAGNASSFFFGAREVFSTDGRWLVFSSRATNLVRPINIFSGNGIYVRDLREGRTMIVNENACVHGATIAGSCPTSEGLSYSISYDGRFVAFSDSTYLREIDSNLVRDVYVRDLTAARTTMVSVNVERLGSGVGESLDPILSRDGSTVAFRSLAGDLSPDLISAPTHNVFALETETGWLPERPLTGQFVNDTGEFSFQVRLATFQLGDRSRIPARIGALAPTCLPDTICVSGAIPDRPEVMLRILGPRSNGFFWPVQVKFSTASVEVWVEQFGTGELRYYRLLSAAPGFDELPGSFDRLGFLAPGLPAPDRPAAKSPRWRPPMARSHGGGHPEDPPSTFFTSPLYPGFEFRVRITNQAGEVQETRLDDVCLDETACFSGAVPGRPEVFARIVGPKPNGFLWPTLVKLTTSQVEVWIDRPATGDSQYYLLDGAAPGFDELPGLFDREGFVP